MTYPPHSGEPQPAYPPPQPYGPPQSGPPQQYGPPPYGPPQSGPPSQYGPPQQYGPPLSGPPGYGPPGFPAAPPPPKSRTVPIVLVSVAIVLVLCVGGGTAFYLYSRNTLADVGTAAARVTITEPATLGGLAKLESEEFAGITADMERELSTYPGAESAFGAIYGSPTEGNMIAALATKATIVDPRKELDASFRTFSESARITGVAAAGTGSLGGVAQCGSSVLSQLDVAVCGWADEGSVGMIMWFSRNADDVRAEFPALRAEIETKG